MKKRTIFSILLIGGALIVNAQENSELPKPDLTGETLDEPLDLEEMKRQASEQIGKDGEAQWYVSMDYAGFEFEVPAGMIVEKGSNLSARYPDGTFGISMSNQEVRGSNQKSAYELCRRLAGELRLPNPTVEKRSFGRCEGAIATGEMEGQNVSIIVLPYNGKQVTTVMLCTPNREAWRDHFMQTLKR